MGGEVSLKNRARLNGGRDFDKHQDRDGKMPAIAIIYVTAVNGGIKGTAPPPTCAKVT
jgi:hypothetical protein